MNPTPVTEYDLEPYAYPPIHKVASSDLKNCQMCSPSVLVCTTIVQRPASPTPSCVSTPSIEFHGLVHQPAVSLNINGAPKNGITPQRRHQRHHRNDRGGSRRPSTASSRRSRPSWADQPATASSSRPRSNRSNRSTIISSGRSRPNWIEQYATTTISHLRYTRGNQDLIDTLDNAATTLYHHEGPYDALSRVRNRNPALSPLRALENQTAGPNDSSRQENRCNDNKLNSHRPLPSQPLYPPGTVDREGRVYDYEEGANIMFDTMRLPGYVS